MIQTTANRSEQQAHRLAIKTQDQRMLTEVVRGAGMSFCGTCEVSGIAAISNACRLENRRYGSLERLRYYPEPEPFTLKDVTVTKNVCCPIPGTS
jgi:hypothetical protein